MKSYENQKLIPMPFNPRMTDKELEIYLQQKNLNINCLALALIESNRRMTQTIKEQERRIALLEKAKLQKPGRNKQTFYLENRELTDADLVELIDSGKYDSIGKMERDLGAHKNQLRNRINRERNRMKIARDFKEITQGEVKPYVPKKQQ